MKPARLGQTRWDETVRRAAAAAPESPLPLTTALLDVAAAAVSFATPGHRSGRSCRMTPDADTSTPRPRLR